MFLNLDPREQGVVIDRLLRRPPKTYREIGNRIKRSQSRANQIFENSMRKWGIMIGNDQALGGFIKTKTGALLKIVPPTIGNRYWVWGWYKDPLDQAAE